MYRRTLPEFLGRSASIAARDFPNAFDLSRRLVTLPTHARLTQSELFRLRDLLDACR
jgi:dTDP-4-amino-4,6-dideoxygalactose transaminase